MTYYIRWDHGDDAAVRAIYQAQSGKKEQEAIQEAPMDSGTEYMVGTERIDDFVMTALTGKAPSLKLYKAYPKDFVQKVEKE